MLTINAYKIDVYTQTLYAVAIQPEDLEDYYHAIGNRTISALFYLPNGDCFIVEQGVSPDTNGHLKSKPHFRYEGYHEAISGNVLIVGTDVLTGFTVSPSTPLERLRKQIRFVSNQNAVWLK